MISTSDSAIAIDLPGILVFLARTGRPALRVVKEGDRQDLPTETIERIRNGGRESGLLLYDIFGDEVNRLVWHLLGADPDHDDIVQSAFHKMVSKLRGVRDLSSLRAWVRACTLNEVRSEIRERRARRRLEEGMAGLNTRGVAVDDHEAKELARSVYAAMERMPTEERIDFALRYVSGCTLEDIAGMRRTSRTTMKRRMARAETRFFLNARKDPKLAEQLAKKARENRP